MLRKIEIAVEHDIGEIVQVALDQIHQQKRDIVKHVDAGHRVVELDAVERRRAILEQADIAKVKIAVTAPHGAAVVSPIEKRGDFGQAFPRGRGQSIDRTMVEGRIALDEIVDVARDRLRHRCTAATGRGFGLGVERRDRVGQVPHHQRRQLLFVRQCREEAIVGKATHLEYPLHCRARAVEGQPPVGIARDRPHIEIERGRGTAVEREFAPAIFFAQGRRRIIEIGKPCGAFQLVDALADQKDVGNMRVDPLDRDAGFAVTGRVGQKGDDFVLVGHPDSFALISRADGGSAN